MSIENVGRKIKGFTLVELLVVIAIIALLVAIVFPAISNALLRGRVTATSVNGRNIHQAIIASSVADVYISAASAFPEGNYPDSSAYFTMLVTGRVMNVAWSFFAPPGVAGYTGTAPLPAINNGWCIVDDSETMVDTAPFLFTRNLNITTLNTPTVPADLLNPAPNNQPFGDKGFAFVTRGGAAFALVGDDVAAQARFDGLFTTVNIEGSQLGNTVLRP